MNEKIIPVAATITNPLPFHFHSSSHTHTNQVLIVGGGVGGLVLAATLSHLNVPYKLFERREE